MPASAVATPIVSTSTVATRPMSGSVSRCSSTSAPSSTGSTPSTKQRVHADAERAGRLEPAQRRADRLVDAVVSGPAHARLRARRGRRRPSRRWSSGRRCRGVRAPPSSAACTAPVSRSARSGRPSDQRSAISNERIAASGLAIALAGDVGRRAVDRLVEAGLAGLAERRRGQHAERAGQLRGLVREDVAEQVVGDDARRTGAGSCTSCMAALSASMCSSVDVGILAGVQRGDHLAPERRRSP